LLHIGSAVCSSYIVCVSVYHQRIINVAKIAIIENFSAKRVKE
jgi:hypothetical protein